MNDIDVLVKMSEDENVIGKSRLNFLRNLVMQVCIDSVLLHLSPPASDIFSHLLVTESVLAPILVQLR